MLRFGKLAMAALGLQFVLGTSAQAAEPTLGTTLKISGKIFERGNLEGAPLFLWEYTGTLTGPKDAKVRSVVLTPDRKKELVVELAEFKDERITFFQEIHNQLGTDGKVEVKGNEAHFTLVKGGKIKTAKEKIGDSFVVGASLVPYMEKHWARLMKGDELIVRFAVLERLETIGFALKKIKDVEYKGQKAVLIRMKPSNWLISQIVDPLTFTFSTDGKKLFELDGRVLPKRDVGGRLKDLDAVTVYENP